MERKLTKKHIFDYELKYKNLINRFLQFSYSDDAEFSISLLDDIVEDIENIFSDDYDIIFEFLNDYKDIIDWNGFISNYNNYGFPNLMTYLNIDRLLDISKSYLNIASWKIIIDDRVSDFTMKSYENFFKKYKDDINWKEFSYANFDFSVNFILEMKDYLNLNMLGHDADDAFYEQIRIYAIDHLEEVLTYKRKEDNNLNE